MEIKDFIITEENAKNYVKEIALWIKHAVQKANCEGVVLGMSGGVDCSTVARLCQEAKVNVHLVLMPYGNDMENTKSLIDAKELIGKFEFNYHIFNIKPAVDNLKISEDLHPNSDTNNVTLSSANIRPRIRMTYLYQYAQCNNFLVIGTGNLSERTVGYFTKWGDGACDINPIGMLTKREVYVLAKYLQVPDSIINKKPSAGLWEGQTDEEELGITYEQIDEFILNGTSGDEQIDSLIKRKNKLAEHKLQAIPIFNLKS